ncbi:MAG: regulator of sigma E protease, partial [Kiritimatiellia bacterium]
MLNFVLGGSIALLVLVIVHEFGHFLMAKILGIGVPVFSFGFGPRLFGFKFKGTDYRFSLIPAGGYVQIEGADIFGEESFEGVSRVDPSKNFMKRPVWQRLLVMLAGPVANLVLPAVVFTGIYLVGLPEIESIVHGVDYEGVAWQAGLRPEDRVVSVNGTPVRFWK